MHHVSRFVRFFAYVFISFMVSQAWGAGYTCPTYKKYTSCAAGYYMTNGGSYNGTPVAGNACTACGSGYTCAGGTANRVAATKSCSAGQYWNGSACATCTAGYRCPGFSNVATSSLTNGYGRYQCAGGTYAGTGASSCSTCGAGTYSGAGASSCAACSAANQYQNATGQSSCKTVSAGYYKASNSAQAACGGNAYYCTGNGARNSVSAGYYSTGGDANTRTGQAACGGNAYYCSGGVRNSVSAGYYSTGGDANTRTGQAQCGGGNYCTGGVSNACPNATTYKRTSFPANYYSPTLVSTAIQPDKGLSAITQCRVLSWWTGTRAELYEYAYYNSSTGKYDNTISWAYSASKAGYYLTTKAGCGSYAYYSEAKECPAGSYCPGKAHVDCNSSNQSTVHTTNFGLNSCPSGYPNSAAGATAITSCYSNSKSRAWTGSAVNGSVPANCASVTSWNNCSNPACAYVAYSNSAGNGDGTIKSGCSTNNASCTKSPAAVTAKANFYVSGATCPACPSTHPNSAGGNIGQASCYITRTNTGAQVDPAMMTGCAARSLSACTPGTCNYKDYYSGTDETCTPTNCTKGQTCTSASANYYLESGVSKACSAFNSTYTKSDGGNITSANCYVVQTKTGAQLNGAVPANCASVSEWNACTPGTCNYKDYYSGTDETCTPSNCTKTPATVSAKSNFYVSGATCPACPSTHPNSAGGNIGQASCYITRTNTGAQVDPAMMTGCAARSLSACTPGTCNYKDYYSGTDETCTPTNCTKGQTCTSASANYYLESGVSKACSAFNSTYTKSDGGNITSANCYVVQTKTGAQLNGAVPANCASVSEWNACTPGTCNYKDYYSATDETCSPTNCTKTVKSVTAKAGYYPSGTTCPSCPAGQYCTGGTAAPANCTGATYSGGGLAQCSDCPAGYDANTTAGKTAIGQCQISCGAGTGVTAANGQCVVPTGNRWIGANTVGYGATSTFNTCLTNYSISGTAAANHDAASDCQISCSGGSYLAAANDTTCSNVGIGYWAGASAVSQGSAGLRNQCPAGLVTIGYGPGADQAGDCGRILHAGDNQIYLRSERATTPSLMVGIGDDVFYGNMDPSASRGSLHITSDGGTYTVYDDSM